VGHIRVLVTRGQSVATGRMDKVPSNAGQELVIGGYIPGGQGVDSIIVGSYREKDLIYVARVRNGFLPASRRQVFGRLRSLETRLSFS
jgi:ATP-dependent DNA ligase